MTRIASLAANEALINRILETQKRLFETEVQVSSEKVAQTYSGLAFDAERLVNFENTVAHLGRFVQNNQTANLRLNIGNSAIDGMRSIISDFQDALGAYSAGGLTDQVRVQSIQDTAFRSLKSIEALLNTEADGRFLFAGTRVKTEPVDLGAPTLSAFQAVYNGNSVTYPTTRDAHLSDLALNKNSTTTAANWLTFARDNAGAPARGRITASGSEFANVKVGSKITLSGTGTNNNGTYTVAAATATTIDIVTEMLTNEGPVALATLTKNDGSVLDVTKHGGLQFIRDNGANPPKSRITATTAASLASVAVGTVFTIAGTASNNGTYTVAANNGTSIDIVSTMLTDFGTAGAPYFLFTGAANLSFVDGGANADTITAPAGTFRDGAGQNLPAGLQLTITGTATNNTTYTIASVSTDGSTVTLASSNNVTAEANTNGTVRTNASAGALTVTSYYNGDTVAVTHRVDELQSFEVDFNGAHPAFEKALRAIGIIAQGVFGTEGGLDQHAERVGQAQFLLASSIETAVAGTPPFGAETAGNLEDLEQNIGFKQVLIQQTTEVHKKFSGFLGGRITEVENVDRLDAVTRLLDDQRTLEASFQALARIKQLSLSQFI